MKVARNVIRGAFCGAVALMTCSAAFGQNSVDASKTYRFRVAAEAIATTSQWAAVQAFISATEKDSAGRIKFDAFPGSQLGAEAALLPQVMNGSVDAALVSSALLSKEAPELAVLDLPYLFKSPEDEFKILEGVLAKPISDLLAKKNLKLLAWLTFGTRELLTTRPVRNIDDLKGLKVRVPNTPVLVGAFKAFGTDPVPLSFSEIYTSLQSGVVQGVETAPESLFQNKFYEVAKNLTITDHATVAVALVFNSKKFESLTPDLQATLLKNAEEAAKKQWATDAAERQGYVEKLQAAGVTVFRIDQAALSQKTESFKRDFVASINAKAIYDTVISASGK